MASRQRARSAETDKSVSLELRRSERPGVLGRSLEPQTFLQMPEAAGRENYPHEGRKVQIGSTRQIVPA